MESVTPIGSFNSIVEVSQSFSNSTATDSVPKSLFMDYLSGIQSSIDSADTAVVQYIQGADVPLHEVMMSLGKAKSELQLAVQVRDKLVAAYQSVMTMQI